MNNGNKLRKYLSPAGVWAFAIGTSVGWGSLVVTSSTYLAQAGPAGSVLGLAAGALVMLVICRNYSYMVNYCPEAGGAYSFVRDCFGYDYGFITAWFLALTYFAMLWANATALPLFGRIFMGNIFRVGKLYTVFGYDVYIGEALLSIAALLIVGALCAKAQRAAAVLMAVLVCLFSAGITVCFIGAAAGGHASMSPAFVPDTAALGQIVRIAIISPWAFIGFESISHGAEEFSFDHRKTHRILVISVLTTLALYVMVTLLSVTAYPPEYANWLEYIRDLDSLEGLKALPAFYAADHYLGAFGVVILELSLLALVLTSLIGNISALSRLTFSMSRDGIMPEKFFRLSSSGTPSNAVFFVVLLSCIVPFAGRTAIGWIVDVTTIGAVLIYGVVSAANAAAGKRTDDRRTKWFGYTGVFLMIVFAACIFLPNLVAKGTLATETYVLFIVWSVLGFLFFRRILHKDREKRFGNSIIVWVALLALVLMFALIWMRQSMIMSNDRVRQNIENYYGQVENLSDDRIDDEEYVEDQMRRLELEDTRTMLMAVGMFVFALVIVLNNHFYMSKRSKENEHLANTDPMTGVKNKHAYMMREKYLDDQIRDGKAPDFAIAVCDVNGLKKINDTYGHKAGDDYIRAACKMVCEIYQHSPVYRIGGDEFVVILTGRDHGVRNELRQLMHDLSVKHIGSDEVVISVGMSDYRPGEDAGAHDVFERADSRMYEEKMLLKSLGSVTRDEESDAGEAAKDDSAKDQIINVRRKLLIVEDEPVNRMMLGNVLEDGYDIMYASDGLEAIRRIRESKDELALILLDLNLPLKNGISILKDMRNDPELKSIPVIVMTADQEAEVECLKLGAMDFIPKPYPSPEIVMARVDKCIELSEDKDIIQSTERDSLTSLFNIDYFMRYVKMYDQHYWDKSMDAVVIDVNHFHMINERFGRAYGDSVLASVGMQIRRFARGIGGVACRRGADAFLLYCPSQDDYAPMLEGIYEQLRQDGGSANRVRLRAGVYPGVDKELDIERRFDRAKIAADNVKENYIQSIAAYDEETHKKSLFKDRLLEDFHTSIMQKDFAVWYQPKFDIRPDEPVLASAEALVRWNLPEFGMISPGVFIPLLEDNGLIFELDQYVWRETAAMIRSWKDRFGFSIPVSVNVSRIDMMMPDLKDIFMNILEEQDLTKQDIILEITESAYTGDSDQIISVARELQGMGMGFRIEMDDFGTGYSSLGMLSRLPIDALKLDMSFVRSAFGETRDVRMIELIIDIADYLQVPVVAEGVETKEQYLELRALGCDYVQGYYFSKPVPADDFDRILTDSRHQR